MKDYLKTFHESFQDLKINTNAELGFCCHKEILNELRQRLISMQQRHSQVFVMMMSVLFPAGYATAAGNELFTRFLADFIRHERSAYGDVEYVWRFERENDDSLGHWHVVLYYNANVVQGSFVHRISAEKYWAKMLDVDSAVGRIHVSEPKSALSYRHDGFKLRRGDPELDKVRNDCFSWISYVAKFRPNIVAEKNKSYGCSQL